VTGEAGERLSTSALARALELPVQQLFATLRDYGWIERRGDHWLLTGKGEFEGGSYRDSNRYGRYIVWPRSLLQHPLLSAIESNERVGAAGLRRFYPVLHPRQINRALAELGLQQHSILGWELTDLGRAWGGQQAESESSGAFYVTWPPHIVDDPVIHRELERLADVASDASESAAIAEADGEDPGAIEPDLFSGREGTGAELHGIDGHRLASSLEQRVCNWLYLAQQVHAHRRALPCEESLYADFYLPAGGVYIDCWAADVPAGELSARLRRREVYRDMGLRSIEVNADDVMRLDEVLGRGLLAFGIRC